MRITIFSGENGNEQSLAGFFGRARHACAAGIVEVAKIRRGMNRVSPRCLRFGAAKSRSLLAFAVGLVRARQRLTFARILNCRNQLLDRAGLSQESLGAAFERGQNGRDLSAPR